MLIFWTKKTSHPSCMVRPEGHVLKFYKSECFKFFLKFFLLKETFNFSAIQHIHVDEIKQSNGIKPPKSQLFHDSCKILHHKGNLCL